MIPPPWEIRSTQWKTHHQSLAQLSAANRATNADGVQQTNHCKCNWEGSEESWGWRWGEWNFQNCCWDCGYYWIPLANCTYTTSNTANAALHLVIPCYNSSNFIQKLLRFIRNFVLLLFFHFACNHIAIASLRNVWALRQQIALANAFEPGSISSFGQRLWGRAQSFSLYAHIHTYTHIYTYIHIYLVVLPICHRK